MRALEYAKTKTLPSDVLAGLLAIAQRDAGLKEFEDQDHELQRALATLVQRDDYPILKAYFIFDESAPDPYSESVEEAVSRLQLGGLIGRINPSYDTVIVRPSTLTYFDRVLAKRFSDDEIRQLEAVARELAKRLSSNKQN